MSGRLTSTKFIHMKQTLAILGFAGLGGLRALAGVFGPATNVPDVDKMAMAVATEGDRLYVAAGKELRVYDIASPLEPKFLGAVAGMDNRRQVKVKDGMAYVVSRETGLRIVDCTDPAKPRIRSRFDSVEFATGVEIAGSVVFLSERINGVEFVDVTDPENPAHIAIRKTHESQSSVYRDGYLYSGEWGAGAVSVFDARDMRRIRRIGEIELHGFGDGLEIAGNCLYCSTGHDAKRRGEWTGEETVGRGRGMDIFALDDPAKPKFVGRVDFPRFKPRNEDFWTVRVSGGVAYCADSHNGLFAVDVRNPAAPKVLDRFCVPQSDKPDWPSGAISSLAIGKGCLYVTSFPGGLFVIPVAGLKPEARPQGVLPVHPEYREPYPTDRKEFFVYKPSVPGQARTAVVRGDYVYAAFGDAGLHVLKIRPEGGFQKVGELPGGRRVLDCCFVGEKFVTAEGLDGFAVYALEGPAKFREEQRRARISDSATVAFWCWAPDAETVVLSGRNSGKMFLPISDINAKALFQLHGGCQWDKYLADRALGGILPNLHPYGGLQWLDLNDRQPGLVGFDKTLPAGQTCGVTALDDRRFLMTFSSHHAVAKDGSPLPSGSFLVLADRDARKPDLIPMPKVALDGKPANGFSGVPRTDGRFLALNNRSSHAVALLDIADRRNPKVLKAWRLAGNPDLCTFWKGRLVIPAGHQGLLMAK